MSLIDDKLVEKIGSEYSPCINDDTIITGLTCQMLPGITHNSDIEDDEQQVACSSLRMVPTSLVTLFRKAGRSLSIDKLSGNRSKTPSPTSPDQANNTGNNTTTPTKSNSKDRSPQEPVKNIYRQPISRTATRPRSGSSHRSPSNSIDLKLHGPKSHSFSSQFAENDEDSISTNREEDGLLHVPRRQTMDLTLHPLIYSKYRPRARSMPSIVRRRLQANGSSNTSPAQRSPPSPGRHTSFKDEVDVCYFYAGRSPSLTYSDTQINDYKQPQRKSSLKVEVPQAYMECQHDDKLIHSLETSIVGCIGGQGKTFKKLSITMKTDRSCIPEKTCVKSLSEGGAFILHLSQVAEEDGSLKECDIVKKILLPVRIDPYHVKAFVHKEGFVKIEAPVMDKQYKDSNIS